MGSSLDFVPTLHGNAARGSVLHGVVKVETVEPGGLQRPVGQRRQGLDRNTVAPGLRSGPVRDLGPPFFQVNGAETDPSDRGAFSSHHPVGAVLALPSHRSCRDPLAGFLHVHRAHVPPLDSRIAIRLGQELGIPVTPRLEFDVPCRQPGLGMTGEDSASQDRQHERGHRRSIGVAVRQIRTGWMRGSTA